MKCKAFETIQRHQLLTPGAAVIAAVSGGADSMALLFLLDEIREEFSLKLSVAHINHGLRGEEADRDEALVRDTCQRFGIPFHVLHTNVLRRTIQTQVEDRLSELLLGGQVVSGQTLKIGCSKDKLTFTVV